MDTIAQTDIFLSRRLVCMFIVVDGDFNQIPATRPKVSFDVLGNLVPGGNMT
jgi:hypothetical protein